WRGGHCHYCPCSVKKGSPLASLLMTQPPVCSSALRQILAHKLLPRRSSTAILPCTTSPYKGSRLVQPSYLPTTTLALKPNGTGGLVIDSGTTFTLLTDPAYAMLMQAFVSQMGLPVVAVSGYDICFSVPLDPSG
ncbi:unnamed protein product, partial [Musa hybrid cultivar]